MTDAQTVGGHESYQSCGARTRSGGLCRRPAGWGTDHAGHGRCKLHAGCTPTVARAAHREGVEADARLLLNRLGEAEPLGHPVTELLAIGAEARAWLRVLREQVACLKDLTSGAGYIERARAVVMLYGDAMDRCERLLVNLVRLDLDARCVRLDEQQAELLADLVEKVLSSPELGLDAPRAMTARLLVAAEARALECATS